MKMNSLARALGAAFAAGVLGACATAPATPERAWSLEPVMTVRHGGEGAAGYYALGRHEELRPPADRALAAYRKAVAADPAHVAAWDALGALHARLGQFEEALRALERAVALAPTASRLHNNLGYALLLAGREEAAVDALRRAVQLDADNRRAWHNLSQAYRRLGEPENADLAQARADGTWPAEPAAPSAATTKPLPAEASRSASHATPAPPARSPSPPVSTAAANAWVVQSGSATRLVKLADNIYALRTTPDAPADAGGAPTPPAPPTPVASATVAGDGGRPLPAVRYEISNGHGGTGLARRIATLLRRDGFASARLTNQPPFNEPLSVLQYRAGHREAAEALAARLPFRPVVREAPPGRLQADVRLVLGRDLTTSAACAELALCPRLAAARAQPVMAASATRPSTRP